MCTIGQPFKPHDTAQTTLIIGIKADLGVLESYCTGNSSSSQLTHASKTSRYIAIRIHISLVHNMSHGDVTSDFG